jgi:sterol desaturase/sphingolipid hydroxylase (fatty acid hydroxylase superfamily)
MLRDAARWTYAPLMLLGFNGAALALVSGGYSYLWVGPLAVAALLVAMAMERWLPHEPEWNQSQGDVAKDAAHGLVYEISNMNAILLLPIITMFRPWDGVWPTEWPLWLQLVFAIVVADIGMTLIHYVSHRWAPLWRLHAIHHGVHRLYSFNGLVRHPLHQTIDLAIGTLPLLLIGMPTNVAVLLGFAVTLQLMVQHSNVDMRLGPLDRVLAIGPVHRLHHVNWAGAGDVNFGLFFTAWDRLLGTYRGVSDVRAPVAGDIGVDGAPAFPQRYLVQLVMPFAPATAARMTERADRAATPRMQPAE